MPGHLDFNTHKPAKFHSWILTSSSYCQLWNTGVTSNIQHHLQFWQVSGCTTFLMLLIVFLINSATFVEDAHCDGKCVPFRLKIPNQTNLITARVHRGELIMWQSVSKSFENERKSICFFEVPENVCVQPLQRSYHEEQWNDHFDFRCWKQQSITSIIVIAVYWLKPCLKEVSKENRKNNIAVPPWLIHLFCVQSTDILTNPLLKSFGRMPNGLFLCDTSVSHCQHWSIQHVVPLCRHLKMCVTLTLLWLGVVLMAHAHMWYYIILVCNGRVMVRYRMFPCGYSVWPLLQVSLFLSDTNMHTPACTYTPRDDKLVVSFTRHVTSKTKIMIWG